MTQPVSLAVVPAQPATEFYTIQQLALFQSYTRDSYLAAFGVQAPAYDPSRLIKTWFDSAADISLPSNIKLYKIATPDAANNWAIRQMVIPAQEAATVNLPGAVQYPAYVVAPTTANRSGSPLNPDYLSLQSDAQALMTALGGSGLALEEAPPFVTVYPPDEPRRLWYFLLNGQPINAGALQLSVNANGVGAPGHWDLSSGAPVWVADPAPTGVNDTRPPRDMPVRDLLPNEMFTSGISGEEIMRTDFQKAADEASGRFLPEDRAALQSILQILIKPAGSPPVS